MGPNKLTLEELAGYATGFAVEYNTATSISVKSGFYESDGVFFNLTADAVHNMTSLVSAFDHHYIYLDKSASVSSIPIFYDETTEPVFDAVRNGWYHPTNAGDRLVGTMPSTVGAATLIPFLIRQSQSEIILETTRGEFPIMASLQSPTGIWADPNTNNGSVVTPVNATAIRFTLSNSDIGAAVIVYAGAAELSPLGGGLGPSHYANGGFNSVGTVAAMNLGTSRDVRLSGSGDDDNALAMDCMGYAYRR